MTVQEAKDRLLQWVAEQVGYQEGANNYNRYAEDKRLAQLYGWDTQNQPWCDLFTDAAFIHCFGLETAAAMTYQPIGDGSAACWRSAQFFKEHGAFSQYPEAGDVVFFYVNGAINHQGIVESVSGGIVHTIEGNSSDSVARRAYSVGVSNIAGYGRPDWEAAATEHTESDEKPKDPDAPRLGTVTVELPILTNGMGGNAVAAMQGILHYQKYSLGVCGVDGEFGVATLAAVRNFQTRNDLDRDGIVGEATWAKLLERR